MYVVLKQLQVARTLDATKHDRLTIERMAGELKTKAPQVEERLHQVLAEAKKLLKN